MGLTGIYNASVPEEDGIQIIKECFNRGITFFDTSDVYGVDHANEILVGKVIVYICSSRCYSMICFKQYTSNMSLLCQQCLACSLALRFLFQ